jgi:hypothetical protein
MKSRPRLATLVLRCCDLDRGDQAADAAADAGGAAVRQTHATGVFWRDL